MSHVSWHNYGRGIQFDDVYASCKRHGDPITAEDLERLLACAPLFAASLHKTFLETGIENPTVEQYEDWDDCYCLGLAGLFAEVVREAEELPYIYACDNHDSEVFVIFGKAHPWDYSEKERQITQEQIDAIFLKYLGILKPFLIDDINIDDEEVENGG